MNVARIFLIIICTYLVGCHENISRIQFSKTVLYIGKINAGDSIRTSFEYKNIGDKPLKITHIDVECECTNITNANKSINPGEFGVINILYKSSKLSDIGEQQKSLSIQTNGVPQNILLYFKVKIINDSLKNLLSKSPTN